VSDHILFESNPGLSVAILPDAPKFTIVAISNDFARSFAIEKNKVVGRSVFEWLREIFDNIDALEEGLRQSLSYVTRHSLPHQFSYSPAENKNSVNEAWNIRNLPVLASAGSLQYIIQNWEGTAQVQTNRLKETDKAYRLFMDAPTVIGIVKGDEYIIELANKDLLEIWGRTTDAIGKPLLQAIPELKGQGFVELLDEVRRTGRSYYATEAPIRLVRNGKEEQLYMNFVYKAFYEDPADAIASSVIAIGYDVTEQVLARRKVEESRQELKLAVEIAELGTFRIDLLTNTAYSSEKINEWFGIGEKEYPLETAFAAIDPEDRSRVEQVIANTLQSGGDSHHNVTYRVIHPENGAVRHLRSFGRTFYNEDQKPYLILGIIQDITSEILQQKQLAQNEALLQKRVEERTEDLNNQKTFIRSILDVSLDGIYALKATRNKQGVITDFSYLFANQHTAKMLNRTPEEVIGASMLQLIPENKTNGFFDLFCKLLQTGEMFSDETHFVAQGIDGWFEYVIIPIDNDTLVVTTRDVTDKKRSVKAIEEQRNLLDSILQNSSNGISVSRVFRDNKGKVIDALTIMANDAAVKYTGLPKEIYLSKKATEIEPAIIDSPYYKACVKTLETGEPFVMQYYMQSTKRWLELTVSKLDDEHLIQIFTDVTPIKETQLQLEKSVEELKRSNQNLEQFAYAASHDLKEPMRKIRLFSDRLKEHLYESLEDEYKHYFNRILQATDRMNTLIDDLLVYSSVSSGAVLDEDVDLNDLVKSVLEDLELAIGENNTKIIIGTLPTIKGNRRQLQQLFQNIIENAVKYKKQEINSEVSITSQLIKENVGEAFPPNTPVKDQPYYLIEINDNGIGFEPENAEKIFDVFTRLHGNAEYKGTGVGLSIVRKVAENHGGYIWAESNLGEGSSFKLILPAT
jgi:PAS domain S-box-containing protein